VSSFVAEDTKPAGKHSVSLQGMHHNAIIADNL